MAKLEMNAETESYFNEIEGNIKSAYKVASKAREKMYDPEPCRVPIVNLKTRDVKILKFG